jgi:hypothetical protein
VVGSPQRAASRDGAGDGNDEDAGERMLAVKKTVMWSETLCDDGDMYDIHTHISRGS